MLDRFKSSSNQREVDVFNCTIHNLFDEYRSLLSVAQHGRPWVAM